eukprot:757845-Hanusia_phi.AAC.1
MIQARLSTPSEQTSEMNRIRRAITRSRIPTRSRQHRRTAHFTVFIPGFVARPFRGPNLGAQAREMPLKLVNSVHGSRLSDPMFTDWQVTAGDSESQ